jgi:hypothetical protein
MSTRVQIAIQIGPDKWAHVYVHFDGYPAHMLSDDHFNTHPDEINWDHVGTLNHYASLLRQITDGTFKEGEHAA